MQNHTPTHAHTVVFTNPASSNVMRGRERRQIKDSNVFNTVHTSDPRPWPPPLLCPPTTHVTQTWTHQRNASPTVNTPIWHMQPPQPSFPPSASTHTRGGSQRQWEIKFSPYSHAHQYPAAPRTHPRMPTSTSVRLRAKRRAFPPRVVTCGWISTSHQVSKIFTMAGYGCGGRWPRGDAAKETRVGVERGWSPAPA